MVKVHHIPKTWVFPALINFLVAGSLGLVLRLLYVTEIPGFDFMHIRHAHSHTAMLGWVYPALYTLLIHVFLPNTQETHRRYHRLYWLTQVAVWGMIIGFLSSGYGTLSIIFSTLHILLSYTFILRFWKDLNRLRENKSPSARFTRAGLVFLGISTLGVWSVPVIMMSGGYHTAWYYASIQFYLHFQFNGWFIFTAFALFLKLMENKSIIFDKIKLNSFFWLLASSCILTYALAVVWSNPVPALFFLNSGGVLLQLAALVFFIVLIRPNLSVIKSKLTARSRLLAGFSAIAFILKILIQAMIVIPELAEIAYTIRLYVVGFLHLLVLGMISSFILALFNEKGLLKLDSGIAALSVFLFLAGIIGSEVLLFLQGTMLWFQVGFMPGFDLILALTTTLLPAGILGLLLSRKKMEGYPRVQGDRG